MKKILIIDDDKDLVHSLKTVLVSAGYTVHKAYSAREGLLQVLSIQPDLIILDVMMESETAGFQLAYKLSSAAWAASMNCGNIPILMLTAIGDIKKIQFDPLVDKEYLPVEVFMEKPVHPDQLLETVQRMLKQNVR